MKPFQVVCILVAAVLLLAAPPTEAKRRKNKGSDHHHHDHDKSDPHKTKTKTKWSTSTNLASNSQVSTEEHGYYVKRTYGAGGDDRVAKKRLSPPYLAIPIAWFSCQPGQKDCQTANSAAINSAAQSLSEGYLCDDDCQDLYDPICGRTSSEVAVFYNKCKLAVAKCRSHGLWADFSYAECQEKYPQETALADSKFRASPYFRDAALVEQLRLEEEKRKIEEVKQRLEKEEKEREKAEKKKKEREIGESSEEQEDHKQKVEEPTTLPKPVETPKSPVPVLVPAPAPVPVVAVHVPVSQPGKKSEEIALPPMPLKDTPTPKPLEIAPLKELTQPKAKDNERLKYSVA